MTKRTKVAAAVITGIICLIAAAVVLISSLNSYFTDPAYARAKAAARSHAQQLKAQFDRLPLTGDAHQQISSADALVASFSTGNANWTHVFASSSTPSTSSISFALDAPGAGRDSLFHQPTDVYVRLCLRLTWSIQPNSSRSLTDTACPADLQPLAHNAFPAVNSIISLDPSAAGRR